MLIQIDARWLTQTTPDIDPPTIYQHDVDLIPAADDMGPYLYLSGSSSRLAGTMISVIDDEGMSAFNTDGTRSSSVNIDIKEGESWIVRIEVGNRGVSRSGTIVLNYKNAIVQRAMATDADDTQAPLMIQAFSGVSAASDAEPQFPVKELVKDIITVKRAADGSGTVEFEYDDRGVVTGSSGNSAMSIPAGLTKDDVRSLIIRYKPEGDMGEGEFEVRLPSGWKAEDILTDGDDETTTTGDPVHTVNVTFLEHFGEDVEEVEITLVDVTVPNNHGNHGFLSKSANEGGSLKQLSPRPVAFVGNTMADNDTVAVEIDPAAAYQNQDNVDFEITVTANGPMHDSEIQITVPDGLSDLQDSDSAKANYVRKASASVSGVEVSVDNEIILIKTGKLNPGGRIKVRLDNVDLDGVSEIPEDGFRVGTRTRTDVEPVEDDPTGNLSGENFEPIENAADPIRSIVGGLIRTIAGSGTMAVEPATIEQSSRNRNIKLTFTATTDFSKLILVIEVPSVIETELQEAKSSDDGYVSTSTSKFHADIEADDRLEISGSTITWTGVTLDRGEKFITNIKRVDLLDDTDDAHWVVTLDGTDITAAGGAAANPPMVVVGTMEEDVVFEVVDESDIPDSNPSYPASSLQSIRFQFTTENTAVQSGGRLWFTVPVGWSLPSLTDKAGKATVSIVAIDGVAIEDADGNPIGVKQLPKTGEADAGSNMALSVSGRSVILSIGANGGLAEGASVTIRYGTADLTATGFPVQISASAKGTTSDGDGLAIRGHFRVSDDFRQRDAGTIWADVTNVVDGSGTAATINQSRHCQGRQYKEHNHCDLHRHRNDGRWCCPLYHTRRLGCHAGRSARTQPS